MIALWLILVSIAAVSCSGQTNSTDVSVVRIKRLCSNESLPADDKLYWNKFLKLYTCMKREFMKVIVLFCVLNQFFNLVAL